jgi:hypothetical protein
MLDSDLSYGCNGLHRHMQCERKNPSLLPAATFGRLLQSPRHGNECCRPRWCPMACAQPRRRCATHVAPLLLQVLAPTAITYQSGLLGFGAAAALYSAVGFSVLPTGLCWCVRIVDLEIRFWQAADTDTCVCASCSP